MTRVPVTCVIEGKDIAIGAAIVGETQTWITLSALPLLTHNSSMKIEGVVLAAERDRLKEELTEASKEKGRLKAELLAARAELAAAREQLDNVLGAQP